MLQGAGMNPIGHGTARIYNGPAQAIAADYGEPGITNDLIVATYKKEEEGGLTYTCLPYGMLKEAVQHYGGHATSEEVTSYFNTKVFSNRPLEREICNVALEPGEIHSIERFHLLQNGALTMDYLIYGEKC